MAPKITVGMAHCDDFEGLWATVQSVFLHNAWDDPEDVEIVIVDTSPIGSEHRRLVADFVRKGGGMVEGSRTRSLKLVDMAGFAGTTAPRDEIFKHATGEVVVVMDCHVMLYSGTLMMLVDWLDKNPKYGNDLIQGPLYYDSLDQIATHFADQWRGQMWGTWSTVWHHHEIGFFSCEHEEVTDEDRPRQSDGKVHFHDVMTLKENREAAVLLGRDIPWAGHERALVAKGCIEYGKGWGDVPVEIPGQGMGLYACRRESWLGYVPNASGFGGEEMNIHTKYRQAGRKTYCLPFLKWNHRFGRAGGAPYPIPLTAKVRNYVLWANHLSLPLDRIETHFVKTGNFPRQEWERMVADPVGYPINFQRPSHASGIQILQPLDGLFAKTARTARDLSEHAEAIRDYAARCNRITAFVKRADWEPMLAHGFPFELKVYQAEDVPLVEETHKAVSQQTCKGNRRIANYSTVRDQIDPLVVTDAGCDMLVLDRDNDAEFLSKALARHGNGAMRYIMIRGTQSFGERSEIDPSKPGLWDAMKGFLERNEEWFILEHRPNQYGLTVLCRNPEERPAKCPRPWPLGYGPGSELKNILDGLGIVAPENCSCRSTMLAMDDLGVDGCRKEFAGIVEQIRANAEKWGWGKLSGMAKLPAAAAKAFLSGIAFKINPLDPFAGLVTEAIERAEKNG